MFEQKTKYTWPWSQIDKHSGKKRYYGRCPGCENAVQLINIGASSPNRTPHGRHWLKRVDGFPYCLDAILKCDLFEAHSRSSAEQELQALTPEADELRRAIPAYFDLMVGLLREDTGFILSPDFAGRILAEFFKSKRYRWPSINPQNVGWLFAYCGTTFSLYDRKIVAGSDLAQAITARVPDAQINARGYLNAKQGKEIKLTFGFRFHRMHTDHGREVQSIQFYVLDLSSYYNDPKDLKTVFEKTISLRLTALERLIAQRTRLGDAYVPTDYARAVNKVAQDVLDAYLQTEGSSP